MSEDSYREVFIKNIPYVVTNNELSEWCSTFGPVVKCVIIRDQDGNSRGFAFVTFGSVEGCNNILSQGPHSCRGRPLVVRPANSTENSSPLDQLSPATVDLSVNETSYIHDDDNGNRLATVRDELEANLECLQIAHDHELKVLRDKLAREKKLLKEAKESHREAEEDWRKINEANHRLRSSLCKNVMQTFNIRKDFARRTKDQLKKCEQIERQSADLPQS